MGLPSTLSCVREQVCRPGMLWLGRVLVHGSQIQSACPLQPVHQSFRQAPAHQHMRTHAHAHKMQYVGHTLTAVYSGKLGRASMPIRT